MKTLRCVHCGLTPRLADAFLCRMCSEDVDVHTEVMLAERMGISHGRAWLVRERGWRGGWHDRVRVAS